jgi:hypothetical protein
MEPTPDFAGVIDLTVSSPSKPISITDEGAEHTAKVNADPSLEFINSTPETVEQSKSRALSVPSTSTRAASTGARGTNMGQHGAVETWADLLPFLPFPNLWLESEALKEEPNVNRTPPPSMVVDAQQTADNKTPASKTNNAAKKAAAAKKSQPPKKTPVPKKAPPTKKPAPVVTKPPSKKRKTQEVAPPEPLPVSEDDMKLARFSDLLETFISSANALHDEFGGIPEQIEIITDRFDKNHGKWLSAQRLFFIFHRL